MATKIWKNIPAKIAKLPTAVIILLRNGVEFREPIELKSEGNGKQEAKWDNLPKYAPDGTDFVYTVDEKSVPEGYVKRVNGLEITNTFYEAPEGIDVSGGFSSGQLGDCVD